MGLSDLHLEVKINKPRDVVNQICMDAIDYGKDHGLFVASLLKMQQEQNFQNFLMYINKHKIMEQTEFI